MIITDESIFLNGAVVRLVGKDAEGAIFNRSGIVERVTIESTNPLKITSIYGRKLEIEKASRPPCTGCSGKPWTTSQAELLSEIIQKR